MFRHITSESNEEEEKKTDLLIFSQHFLSPDYKFKNQGLVFICSDLDAREKQTNKQQKKNVLDISPRENSGGVYYTQAGF